jgi:hypothetical protein
MLKLIFKYSMILLVYPQLALSQPNPEIVSKYGYLLIQPFEFNFDSIYIVIDEIYTQCEKKSIFDYIQIPAGNRKIRIITKDYDDFLLNVTISEGDTVTQQVFFSKTLSGDRYQLNSSYSWAETGTNVTIITDMDSEVFIDGILIRQGTVKADLSLGPHKIETRNMLVGTSKSNVNILSKKQRKLFMFNRPDRRRAQWLSIFPGASQYYKGEKVKSSIFTGLTTICLAISIKYQLSFRDENSKYEWSKYHYIREGTDLVVRRGDITQELYDSAKYNAKMRDIFLYSGIGIYLLNIIDGLFNDPDGGYRKHEEINFLKDLKISIDNNSIGFSYTLLY